MKKKLKSILKIIGYILGGLFCATLLIGVIILATLVIAVISYGISEALCYFNIVKLIFKYGMIVFLGFCLFGMGLCMFDEFLKWVNPFIRKLKNIK